MVAAPPRSAARTAARQAERRRSLMARLGFLLLLTVACAQVFWWVFDQARLMDDLTARQRSEAERERTTARVLLDAGVPAERVGELLPALEVGDDGSVAVSPDFLESLDAERRRHLNQYFWEGAFFLAVLLTGMVVLWRAVSREMELRRRQENFLAAVTHELRSPLASLRLALESMGRRRLAEPELRGLVERNLLDLDRLDGLIENVLTSSRLDGGGETLHPEPVALARVADDVLGAMAKIEEVGCDVVNGIPRNVQVHADPVAVRTVLRNLLDNAVEATRPVAEPTVRLDATVADGRVVLVVEDNGVGFAPEEAERLFEKFYRPGDEMTRARSGTGLGLHLVRRFVELEGGSVGATSRGVGEGARFEVVWPEA